MKILKLFPLLFILSASLAFAEEKTVKEYYQEALFYDKQQDWRNAEKFYTKALELNPNYVILYYGRGQARFNLDELDEASQDFAKIIELTPQSKKVYRAYCLRAQVFNERRNFKAALADLEKALALNPQSAEVHGGLGDVYLKMAKTDLALEEYTHAIELGPPKDIYYSGRAKAYFNKSKYNEAIEDYDRAIGLDPKNDETYAERGKTHFILSHYRKALDDFNRAVEINPSQKVPLADFIDQAKMILNP